jgi:RHS repeat-associated protein
MLTSGGNAASNYGFTGEWTDGTGLQYLRARYYAPGLAWAARLNSELS